MKMELKDFTKTLSKKEEVIGVHFALFGIQAGLLILVLNNFFLWLFNRSFLISTLTVLSVVLLLFVRFIHKKVIKKVFKIEVSIDDSSEV